MSAREVGFDPMVIQLKMVDGLSPYKVHQRFTEIYGAIETSAFIPGFGFIYVCDGMSGTIKNHTVEVEGQIIQCKQADCSYIPYEMYRHVKTQETTSNAPVNTCDKLASHSGVEESAKDISMTLNDHCLREVLVRLCLTDLLSVAKTCKRLKGIAGTVFESKHRKKVIELKKLVQTGNTMILIEYFLKTFGPSIDSIDLRGLQGEQFDLALGLIDKHCTNVKLLSFAGRDLQETRTNIETYADLCGRLETVQITGGFLSINTFLSACSQLKVLAGQMIDCLDLTHVSLPRLIEIRLSFFKCAGMGEFLIRHPQVEVLEMAMPDPMVTFSLSLNPNSEYDETDQFIFRNLPNIREMEIFKMSTETISHFGKMKNLKSLYVDGDGESVAAAMEQLSSIPIEKLELARGTIDTNVIKYICEMKSLKKIHFFECNGIDANSLIRLMLKLPNLKEIGDSSNRLIKIDTILPIVKSKCIKWLNEIDRESFVSYDPHKELLMMKNID